MICNCNSAYYLSTVSTSRASAFTMHNIGQSLQGVTVPEYEIGVEYGVEITYIKSVRSFYVRPKECPYLAILEQPGELIRTSNISLRLLVVYKSKTASKYIRGMIYALEKKRNSGFLVLAIDYGFFDNFVCSKWIYMPATSINIPGLAKHCCLANCNPINSSFIPDAKTATRILIGNQYWLLKVQDFEKLQYVVTLKDIALPKGLSHNSNYEVATKSSSRIPKPKFFLKKLKVNDVYFIVTLKKNPLVPNTYYVACEDEYEHYTKTIGDFNYYCWNQKDLTPDKLQVGSVVGYKPQYRNQYQRAVIKNIVQTGFKALIHLLDIGETKEASLYELKEIDCLQYFETPGIAFECFIEDSVGVTEDRCDWLKQGLYLWIKIKQLGYRNIVEKVAKPNI